MKKLTVFCAAACLAASAAAQNHPDLHEVLDRQKGRNLIEIPKGTYTLDVRNNGPYKFHNLTDVHINGNGSTVICNNQEQAFSFYNCVRVELRDPDHRLRSALLYAGRDYGRSRRRKLVRRPDRRGVSRNRSGRQPRAVLRSADTPAQAQQHHHLHEQLLRTQTARSQPLPGRQERNVERRRAGRGSGGHGRQDRPSRTPASIPSCSTSATTPNSKTSRYTGPTPSRFSRRRATPTSTETAS